MTHIDSIESYSEFDREGKSFFESLKSRLALTKILMERVENPTWVESPEEIGFLLLDLGSSLMESQLDRKLNSEVFEDPLNRGDALGNVLMISKRQSRLDSEMLTKVGEGLCQLAHNLLQCSRKELQIGEVLETVNFSLEGEDEKACCDLLAAQKHVVELRRENNRLDRRNQALWLRLQKSKDKDLAQKDIVKQFDIFQFRGMGPHTKETYESLKMFDSSKHAPSEMRTPATSISCRRDKGMQKHQSRKLEVAQNAKSQVNFLWDDENE